MYWIRLGNIWISLMITVWCLGFFFMRYLMSDGKIVISEWSKINSIQEFHKNNSSKKAEPAKHIAAPLPYNIDEDRQM